MIDQTALEKGAHFSLRVAREEQRQQRWPRDSRGPETTGTAARASRESRAREAAAQPGGRKACAEHPGERREVGAASRGAASPRGGSSRRCTEPASPRGLSPLWCRSRAPAEAPRVRPHGGAGARPSGLPSARRKRSPDPARRGKMALDAGDMEEGQLSDSDSDMTVVPSDRPTQMAVSERARGRRGWAPGAARPGWRGAGGPGMQRLGGRGAPPETRPRRAAGLAASRHGRASPRLRLLHSRSRGQDLPKGRTWGRRAVTAFDAHVFVPGGQRAPRVLGAPSSVFPPSLVSFHVQHGGTRLCFCCPGMQTASRCVAHGWTGT